MHARIGLYQVKPGTLDASLAKARAELLPKMREQEGLRRYTVITTGPDSFVSLSGWDTRAQAEQAEKTLSGWVKGRASSRWRATSARWR
jgi:quinol monooxygenase YgiN